MDFDLLWQKEYEKKGIPSSYRKEASQPVQDFLLFLKEKKCAPKPTLDLGCGRGRNSFFFAQHGFPMTSVDFVKENCSFIQNKKGKWDITAVHHDLSKRWPFSEGVFSYAFDIFCFKHLVDHDAIALYIQELHRVLKKGGYYCLSLASIEDGYYGQLKRDQENRIIDPSNGIGSTLYTKEKICALFNPFFHLEKYANRISQSGMHGKQYERSVLNFIFSAS